MVLKHSYGERVGLVVRFHEKERLQRANRQLDIGLMVSSGTYIIIYSRRISYLAGGTGSRNAGGTHRCRKSIEHLFEKKASESMLHFVSGRDSRFYAPVVVKLLHDRMFEEESGVVTTPVYAVPTNVSQSSRM